MATPAAQVSASSDRINYFRECQIVVDHIPKVLRKVFKQEVSGKKHKHPWMDGPHSGAWLKNIEKWTRKLRPDQQQLLWSGDTGKWDPTLLFHILLYSSLGLFIEEIPGASVQSRPNRITLPSSKAPLPASLKAGNKIIIHVPAVGQYSDFVRIMEIISHSATHLQLDNNINIRVFASPSAKVYRCTSEWSAIDSLRIMRNEKYGHVTAASVPMPDFKQFLKNVEIEYVKILGMSGSRGVIAELKYIATEEIIDPETKRRYAKRMELEAKQYDELSQKVKEQEQQIRWQGKLMDEQGDRIDEHDEQIKSMSEQTKSNTEQIGTIKAKHEKMNSRMNEIESKVQDNSAHVSQRQDQLEGMQETMAETRVDVANIQSQQSSSGSQAHRGVEGAMRMFQINQPQIVNIQVTNLPFQLPTAALAGLIPSPPSAQGQRALMSVAGNPVQPGGVPGQAQFSTPTQMQWMDTTTQCRPRKQLQLLSPMLPLPNPPVSRSSSTGALAWLERQPNIKPQFSFTLRSSKDGTFQHRCTITFMKDGHAERICSDYCLTEAEAKEQAARKLQEAGWTSRMQQPETLSRLNEKVCLARDIKSIGGQAAFANGRTTGIGSPSLPAHSYYKVLILLISIALAVGPSFLTQPPATQKSPQHPGHFRGLLNQLFQGNKITSPAYTETSTVDEANVVRFIGVVTFTHQVNPKKFTSRGVHTTKVSAHESAAEQAYITIGTRIDRGGSSTTPATPFKPSSQPKTSASATVPKPAMSPSDKTPVSKLKELCEQKKWPLPVYTPVQQLGEQRFQFRVMVKTPTRSVTATGSVCGSKAEAKHSAAQAIIPKL